MSSTKAEFLMLTVTFWWGASYLLMKEAMHGMGPFNLMALRFGVAFVVMTVCFFHRLRHLNREIVLKGLLFGVILYFVFFGMISGTNLTTASAAAFLTSTAVILVPVMESVLHRALPSRLTVLSTLTALIGLYFLTVTEGFSMDAGSLFCLMGAFFYALYIVVVDRVHMGDTVVPVMIIQLGVTSLLGLVTCLLAEDPALPHGSYEWGAVLALGFFCSAYGFVVQPIAQRYTTPEKIGLIFSMEPIFGALLSYLFLNEILTGREYLGIVLIFTAVLGPRLLHLRRVKRNL